MYPQGLYRQALPNSNYKTFVEGLPIPPEVVDPRLQKLYKDDFVAGTDGRLRLYDRRFASKNIFVVFVINYCMPCQDTKQMWQAYAVDASVLQGSGPTVCTNKMQYIMYKNAGSSILTDYNGPLDIRKLTSMLR
jgi:hypothetical protein